MPAMPCQARPGQCLPHTQIESTVPKDTRSIHHQDCKDSNAHLVSLGTLPLPVPCLAADVAELQTNALPTVISAQTQRIACGLFGGAMGGLALLWPNARYGHTVESTVGTSSTSRRDLIVTQRPIDRRELAQLLPRVLVILLVLQ